MLRIIVSILAVIGWILVALIAVFLLMIILVLAVPVRYRFRGEYEEKPYAKFDLYWLLRTVQFQFLYEEQKTSYVFKVCGLDMKRFLKKSGATTEATTEATIIEEPEIPEETHVVEEKNLRKRKRTVKKKSKLQQLIEILKNKWNSLCNTKARITAVIHWWQKDSTNRAYEFLKAQVIMLLKSLRPKKGEAYLKYGTGSPETTGYITALLAMIYANTEGRVQAEPNFLEAEFAGIVWMAGTIKLRTIVWILGKLLLNKDIRKAYHDWKIKNNL